MMPFGKVIAHRGASAYAPENTLAAFRKAKELGAQWIECDTKLTRDGEVIIFHDSRLNRTTNGSGWVRWKKYEAITHLDAGNGERIIRLKELLDVLDEIHLSVNIEIKPDFQRVKETTEKVMTIVQEHPKKNISILISSFNQKSLKIVRALDKTIPIGLLLEKWSSRWKFIAERLACYSVHCSKSILTPMRVQEIKDTHRKVFAYTVNDKDQAKSLFQMKVDAIFSDYPDLMK